MVIIGALLGLPGISLLMAYFLQASAFTPPCLIIYDQPMITLRYHILATYDKPSYVESLTYDKTTVFIVSLYYGIKCSFVDGALLGLLGCFYGLCLDSIRYHIAMMPD